MAGDQVPEMPLSEVLGKEKVFPAHWGPTWVKVGTVLLFTPIVIVVPVAHCPALGVNV